MYKRGQITIFVIVGIIIIVGLVLLFYFRGDIVPSIGNKPEENPGSFMEVCLENKIVEGVNLISSQGGYVEPVFSKKFKFSDEKSYINISYLCYNQNYYLPCINQEPILITHLKEELADYIDGDVKNCFDELAFNLNEKGYVVEAKYNGFDLDLGKNKVLIEVEGKLVLTKSGKTTEQNNISLIIPTRFYDLGLVVQEIVSQEARFCNFENQGFVIFYPEFEIERFRSGEGMTIYRVKHKESKEEFKFAVRGCVIPPGI